MCKVKESVIIKSSKNGLMLVLDPLMDFRKLVEEICLKFTEARDFFKDAKLVLSIEGRVLTSDELAIVIEAIELNSDVKIKLISIEDELVDARMAAMEERFYFEDFFTNAKIIPGSVKARDFCESKDSIVILGDVARGGRVEAEGNIIVFGEILGSVRAGCGGDKRCYIGAEFIDSEELAIANVEGVIRYKKSLFSGVGRHSTEPVAVYLKEDVLMMEPLSKGVVKQLLGK